MTALRPGLIRWAKRIGLWLVRRLAKWVATKLIAYMQGRVDDWNERKVKPKGRIRRWTAAIAWLKSKLPALNKVTTQGYEILSNELAANGVPEVAA